MSNLGTLYVRVFTSKAQLPLEGATVVVTQQGENGKYDLISVQSTDSSGLIRPVEFYTPPRDDSTNVDSGDSRPFVVCDVWAEHPGFAMLRIDGVQIFPDVVTEQRMELLPLEEGEHGLNRIEERQITNQNL